MDGSTINALMAEMDPEEIRLIPRLVDAWRGRGGWTKPRPTNGDGIATPGRRSLAWIINCQDRTDPGCEFDSALPDG